jgi:hypothetical protein
MAPSLLQQFIQSIRTTYEEMAMKGESPDPPDQPGHPPLCQVDHRTFPSADDRHVAKRNSSKGQDTHGRPDNLTAKITEEKK